MLELQNCVYTLVCFENKTFLLLKHCKCVKRLCFLKTPILQVNKLKEKVHSIIWWHFIEYHLFFCLRVCCPKKQCNLDISSHSLDGLLISQSNQNYELSFLRSDSPDNVFFWHSVPCLVSLHVMMLDCQYYFSNDLTRKITLCS